MKEVYEVTEKDGTWGALFVIWGALKEDQASDETASVKFWDLPWDELMKELGEVRCMTRADYYERHQERSKAEIQF